MTVEHRTFVHHVLKTLVVECCDCRFVWQSPAKAKRVEADEVAAIHVRQTARAA